MRRLGFLLRPQWLALFLLVIAFAYLCFTVLAPWQLGKNTSTSHRNDLINQSVDAEPVAPVAGRPLTLVRDGRPGEAEQRIAAQSDVAGQLAAAPAPSGCCHECAPRCHGG